MLPCGTQGTSDALYFKNTISNHRVLEQLVGEFLLTLLSDSPLKFMEGPPSRLGGECVRSNEITQCECRNKKNIIHGMLPIINGLSQQASRGLGFPRLVRSDVLSGKLASRSSECFVLDADHMIESTQYLYASFLRTLRACWRRAA